MPQFVKSLVLQGAALLMSGGSVTAMAGVASADATGRLSDSEPMLKTQCTAEQIMAAARRQAGLPRAVHDRLLTTSRPTSTRRSRDRIHWFYSMDYAGRRRIPRRSRPISTVNRWRSPGPTGEAVLQQQGSRGTPPTCACSTRPTTCPFGSGRSYRRGVW